MNSAIAHTKYSIYMRRVQRKKHRKFTKNYLCFAKK